MDRLNPNLEAAAAPASHLLSHSKDGLQAGRMAALARVRYRRTKELDGDHV